MKKKLLISIILLLILCVAILSACNNAISYQPKEKNLAIGATFEYSNGKSGKNKINFTGKTESSVTVSLTKKEIFNTIVLESDKNNIDDFEIYIDGKLIYKQDEIGQFRNCFVDTQETDKFVIKVLKSDGAFKINQLGVYNMPRDDREFRTTSYLETGENCSRLPSFDKESLKHLSQVIIFNATDFTFTEESEVSVNYNSLETALDFIRTANPNIEVFVCLLPKALYQETLDLGWPHSIAKIHSSGYTKDTDKLISQINNLINNYNLAGIAFDYEYPQNNNDWKIYSDFVVKLKSELGTKKLSLAIQYFGGNFSKEALAAVDQFEIMCYDFIGKNNAHSPFYEAISMTLGMLENAKFDMKKVNIGLPFYSRPQTVIEEWSLIPYWGEYKEYYTQLGKYTNQITVNKTIDNRYIESLYFNSYQMIMDKTSFCYDYGVGGVMVWNYGSDLPYSEELSLHKAINQAIGRV